MTGRHSSLRLRPWAALLIFVSAYAPLLLIVIIKDFDPSLGSLLPRHPLVCLVLLAVGVVSCIAVLVSVRSIKSGLAVEVSKASNKSGEMFGYSVPYVLSFVRVDLGDWQIWASLAIFLSMLFAISYRTQTVLVNPVLALAGYSLVDCTFKRGTIETQALVLTREPVKIGEVYVVERLSHYLYAATAQATPENET